MNVIGRMICIVTGLGRIMLGVYLWEYSGGRALLLFYGGIEVWIGGASVMGAVTAERVESRISGLALVPIYWAGLFVTADGHGPAWLDAVALAVCGLRVWALAALGSGMSVGVAIWAGLAESGPYRWVRHPVQVTSILARVSFALAVPSLWNVAGLVFVAVSSVGMVIIEERFLRDIEAWREYAGRVRWRLLPGVW